MFISALRLQQLNFGSVAIKLKMLAAQYYGMNSGQLSIYHSNFAEHSSRKKSFLALGGWVVKLHLTEAGNNFWHGSSLDRQQKKPPFVTLRRNICVHFSNIIIMFKIINFRKKNLKFVF
jgi:hypothetical protein